MNWIGAARTNYVKVRNMAALLKALEPFPVRVVACSTDKGMHAILSEDEGGWPAFGYDEEDNDLELDVTEVILPHLEPGQVLVIMEAGHEGLRYVSGFALAWCTTPPYRMEMIVLNDIYEKAKAAFGIEPTAAER